MFPWGTVLDLLRCPESGEALQERGGVLVSASGRNSYTITASGVPLFAEQFLSAEARTQAEHYDRIACCKWSAWR